MDQLLRYHLYQRVLSSGDIFQVPLFPHSYFTSDDLVTGGQVASVGLDNDGNVMVTSGLKRVSQVTTADVTFDNGIIHIVDSVLAIPGKVSEVQASVYIRPAVLGLGLKAKHSTMEALTCPSNIHHGLIRSLRHCTRLDSTNLQQ